MFYKCNVMILLCELEFVLTLYLLIYVPMNVLVCIV